MALRVALLSVLLVVPSLAQEKPDQKSEQTSPPKDDLVHRNASVGIVGADGTEHTIDYESVTGRVPLLGDDGDKRADVFLVGYFMKNAGDVSARPITFVFNGGPGSPAVWLHLGGLGPRVVQALDDEGHATAAESGTAPNPDSWLDLTDLVFIDPVGTGYSRQAGKHTQKEFSGMREDIGACGDLVAQLVGRFGRWSSPKYLAGESYGTFRCAGLAKYLDERKHLRLDGITLISSILDFGADSTAEGVDRAYALYLPSYAAIGVYHGVVKLKDGQDLDAFLADVQDFALGDYLTSLAQGDRLDDGKRREIAKRVAAYTGLSEAFVLRCNLRVTLRRFTKELLRDRGLTVGRLDGRYTGVDKDDAGEGYEYDPSMANVDGVFLSALHGYVAGALGYETDLEYESMTGKTGRWPYAPPAENRYAETASDLRTAMHRNPFLHVVVLSGRYDLATPYFATDWTFAHMGLRDGRRDNVTMRYFESGHMIYMRAADRGRIKGVVRGLYSGG